MSLKPHVLLLLAIAAASLAAVAWAADAPHAVIAHGSTAPASHMAPGAHAGAMAAELGDDDDMGIDLEGFGDDGAPDGAGGGDRRVIVRRFVRGGDGDDPAEACGPMCGMGRRGGRSFLGPRMAPGMRERGPGMGHGMGQGPGAMFGRALHALDLTDAQREKLADLHERQQRRDIQARADLEIARLDLHKAMRAEKPEASAINAQIDRVAKLRTDMAKAHVAALLEARAMLTPEQQKQLRDMHGAGPGPGPGGMGHGFGMGPAGRGEKGMGPGHPQMHMRMQRDTLNRN